MCSSKRVKPFIPGDSWKDWKIWGSDFLMAIHNTF